LTKKILIIGPAWIGDMVMAQSLFLTLKQVMPNCRIDVLAPAWSLPILQRMPEVTHVIAMPLTHGQFGLSTRYKLGRQLHKNHYHQAIVLPNSWKSALIPFFAGIPQRTGFLGEQRFGLINDSRILNTTLLTMTVERFVSLAYPASDPKPVNFAQPRLVVDIHKQHAVRKKFILHQSASKKILALCPGAEFGAAKRWPAAYFAEVAREKLCQGWQVWLLGSDKDLAITEQINQLCEHHCTDFAGKTSLADAVDLLSLADTVISNDSGLMHIAAALNKQLIVLYGSSDPTFTPPLNNNAHILSLRLTCSPCFQRECPIAPAGDENHLSCLTGIRPELVLKLIPR